MKSRIQDAVNMFESGFNCAQSVFVTYADISEWTGRRH